MRFLCVYTPNFCTLAKATGAVRADRDCVLLHWVIGNLGFRVVINVLSFNYGPIVRMEGRGLISSCSELRPLASSCECISRTSDTIIFLEFHGWLENYQLLKDLLHGFSKLYP